MLTISGQLVKKDILDILEEVKDLNPSKLREIRKSSTDIQVTCPVHANGQEQNPSCFINVDTTQKNVEYGCYHCFTCGSKGSFSKFVGACFDRGESFGTRWLLNRYADQLVDAKFNLEPIDLSAKIIKPIKPLDNSILDGFDSYHPYMTKRGISDTVIKEFNLKYDPKRKCIVFPVYDENNKLRFLTRRSVEGKQFYLDKDADKDIIYGLNKAKDYSEVYVCESQINALTLWSWGYPSVALFGAGTTYNQVMKLKNSNIKSFVLCYDPDSAGFHGAERFKKFIGTSKFVTTLKLPKGKDVNDLTKEEFEQILSLQKIAFTI